MSSSDPRRRPRSRSLGNNNGPAQSTRSLSRNRVQEMLMQSSVPPSRNLKQREGNNNNQEDDSEEETESERKYQNYKKPSVSGGDYPPLTNKQHSVLTPDGVGSIRSASHLPSVPSPNSASVNNKTLPSLMKKEKEEKQKHHPSSYNTPQSNKCPNSIHPPYQKRDKVASIHDTPQHQHQDISPFPIFLPEESEGAIAINKMIAQQQALKDCDLYQHQLLKMNIGPDNFCLGCQNTVRLHSIDPTKQNELVLYYNQWMKSKPASIYSVAATPQDKKFIPVKGENAEDKIKFIERKAGIKFANDTSSDASVDSSEPQIIYESRSKPKTWDEIHDRHPKSQDRRGELNAIIAKWGKWDENAVNPPCTLTQYLEYVEKRFTTMDEYSWGKI